MRLEQAIYTSIRGDRLDGYQLAAVSDGISVDLAKELSAWGPAHDSLWSAEPGAISINFHPLAGGQFCLSRTTLNGAEYSGRGGGRVYTQQLVLTEDALSRFANDPFLVLQAIEAAGRLVVFNQMPASLPTIPLLGRASSSPADRLEALSEPFSADLIAELAAAFLDDAPIAVVTNVPAERLFHAALSRLVPQDRSAVSFTTGLRPSPRRPFRVATLPSDPALVRQSQRVTGCRTIEALAPARSAPAWR